MAIEIIMPRFSDVMAEGAVVAWRAEPGGQVRGGEVIAEIETEKAVVELEAPADGVLVVPDAELGRTIAAGGLIAVLAERGEDAEEVRLRYAEGASEPSGEAAPPSEVPADADVRQEVPLRGMRAAVARRTVRSMREIPQYHVTADCDVANLVAARKALRKRPATRRVSMNAVILKCVAEALRRHPMLNAVLVDEVIYEMTRANIAMAVALPEGVVMPVIRDVGGRPLTEVHAELEQVFRAARSGRLREDQLQGGTFSISLLGSLGVRSFSALVHPPQVAILSVGTIRHEPVVSGGEIVPGLRMALTVTADHRAVDGLVAGEFLKTFHSIIEEPMSILS